MIENSWIGIRRLFKICHLVLHYKVLIKSMSLDLVSQGIGVSTVTWFSITRYWCKHCHLVMYHKVLV